MKRSGFIVLEVAQRNLNIPFRLLQTRTAKLLDGTINLSRFGGGRFDGCFGGSLGGRLLGVCDSTREVGHFGQACAGDGRWETRKEATDE